MVARKKDPPPDRFDWKKFVNDLDVPGLEAGDDAPTDEIVTVQQGRYTKLVFEVNLFTSDDTDKCFMIFSQQRMLDYGKMTLTEAVIKAKRHKAP